MAAKKLTPQQQRDRRGKIMLAVLGVVLLAVLAFQLPALMGGGGGSAAPPPAATTSASGTAASSAALASAPAPSQLQRFTRFAPKDPFKAKVTLPAPAGATTTAASTTIASSPATTTTAKPAAPKPTKPPTVLFNLLKSKTPVVPTGPLVPAALLTFDGKKHVVPLGEMFPANHPLFQLVSLAKDAVWLKLVGGSFANGEQTLKLVRGRKIELENTTAGVRIALSLVKPTTAPKPAAAPTKRPTTGGG